MRAMEVVVLDMHRHRQRLRAGVDENVEARLQRLVEAFQLDVGLRMMRRTAEVRDRLRAHVSM